MGYFLGSKLVNVTEPKTISLAGQPNFVIFASADSKTTKQFEAQIQVVDTANDGDLVTITDPVSKNSYQFIATKDQNRVAKNTFFCSSDKQETSDNLAVALLTNPWIATNFDLAMNQNNSVDITSKGAGSIYNMKIDAQNPPFASTYTTEISTNTDTILEGESLCEIELNVYAGDTYTDTESRNINGGALIVQLQKTYIGDPLWFELNGIFNSEAYNKPLINSDQATSRWFDAGTIQNYRLEVKTKSYTSIKFYKSNILYILNAYARASDTINFDEYNYTGANKIKLLSTKPVTFYRKNQKAYLNFISISPLKYDLQIYYKVYSQSGKYIDTWIGEIVAQSKLNTVNSCLLDIDTVIAKYPNAGKISAFLGDSKSIISANSVDYIIRPECLHKLSQFVFLNSLGGWDCFNFDAEEKNEIKVTNILFKKMIAPGFSKGDSIETSHRKTISNPYTVQGAPVSNELAEWLKELAVSKVVFDGDGNYIIIDDFSLIVAPDKRDMQIPTIKYHRSESFNNEY